LRSDFPASQMALKSHSSCGTKDAAVCAARLGRNAKRLIQEKEMATQSSVLAWGIPGTGKPGGLLSIGSHRVGHDWSNLAVAAAGHGQFSHWRQHFNLQTQCHPVLKPNPEMKKSIAEISSSLWLSPSELWHKDAWHNNAILNKCYFCSFFHI